MLPARPRAYSPAVGFILSVRRAIGLAGRDDGGLGSALRNVAQIELFGAVVQEDPWASSSYEVVLDEDELPWELREQDRRARERD